MQTLSLTAAHPVLSPGPLLCCLDLVALVLVHQLGWGWVVAKGPVADTFSSCCHPHGPGEPRPGLLAEQLAVCWDVALNQLSEGLGTPGKGRWQHMQCSAGLRSRDRGRETPPLPAQATSGPFWLRSQSSSMAADPRGAGCGRVPATWGC